MVTFSQQTSTGASQSASARGMNKTLLPLVAVVAVVALLIGGGYYFWRGREVSISSGEYHAVFLSNDQVYFGKIVGSTNQEVVLNDVYYLLLSRPAQVQPQTPEATPGAQVPQPKYILMHLGDREMHGPMDEMRINRAQVLFIEPLSQESKVIRGIKDYKEAKKQRQQTGK